LQVALDACGHSERKATRGREERFARWWTVVKGLEVVGGIDTEAGVGQDVERERLEVRSQVYCSCAHFSSNPLSAHKMVCCPSCPGKDSVSGESTRLLNGTDLQSSE
jgi:hypothetical protein